MEEWRATYENDLKEHLLVDLHEFLIPLLNVRGLLAGIGVIIVASDGIVAVMLAPLEDLLKNRLIDLGIMLVYDQRQHVKGKGNGRRGRVRTLGMGTSVSTAPSPRSSIMFLMSMERSAT